MAEFSRFGNPTNLFLSSTCTFPHSVQLIDHGTRELFMPQYGINARTQRQTNALFNAVQLVSGILPGTAGPTFANSAELSALREALKDLENTLEDRKASQSAHEKSIAQFESQSRSLESNEPQSAFELKRRVDVERDTLAQEKRANAKLEADIQNLKESVRNLKRGESQISGVSPSRYRPSEADKLERSRERASAKAYRNQVLDAERDLRDFILNKP